MSKRFIRKPKLITKAMSIAMILSPADCIAMNIPLSEANMWIVERRGPDGVATKVKDMRKHLVAPTQPIGCRQLARDLPVVPGGRGKSAIIRKGK